ncbi:protease pro-enzyme activation domain-containing protein [Tunturibacter empetritectus]|uniref:Subtilase family serine protease n=1 Tax=Tunturiibacter lichenicola TaxID=2051959 RepID=A0A7W8N321_9BACT|nr:protease pro-enzyme activation domain-containing protein [Edaphobacter lichenicola]MBB5343008.1 subtilase family serine protease [Edaphobacter lichenicola]
MRSRLLCHLIAPVALFAFAFSHFAQAVVQNRIASAANDGVRTPVSGTVVSRAQRATDLGTAPADKKLESMSLRFSMTPAQQADLTQLLANQLNPSSASYHQWLTPEQFGARFGLSSADVAKVSAWLTSQGFTITRTARSSTFISFSGTVAQAQQAFGTSIHNLSLNGEAHFANVADPVLPSAIAGVVTSIVGLNDFKAKPHSRARNVSSIDPSQPHYTQTVSGVTSHYISPADFYTIYDENPLLTASTPINGTGVTIAVMGNTNLNSGNVLPDANVAQFRTAAGLPAINLKLQSAIPAGGSDAGVSAADVDEAHLDVEWSSAAAPGATILYVYSSNNIFADSLTYAIDNKVAPIITISYGLCESGWGTAMLASYNSLLAQANAQGQTVVSSSGDAGATDCDVTGLATEGLNVDFPSSSPYVTSAGGTMFSGDVNDSAQYWNSNNASNGGSALSYILEQPWNETSGSGGLTAGGAGGGGASAFFSKPGWQTGLGVPNDSSRDLPDISLNAAALHDGYLVCSSGDGQGETPCVNGFLSSNGQPNVFGGTSFVAPSFAGVLALVEQQLGSAATGGLGNIGPTLYGFLNGPTYSTVFHDTIAGSNQVTCTQGTLDCPNGGAIGYYATPGYDLAMGLGSFDINSLVTGWSGVKPVGTGGSGIGTSISTTALTTSSSLCAVSAGTLALNVAVTGTASGPTPAGSVQFFVDNVAVAGGTVTLSGGTASYSLVTSSLSSGGHTISAVYSGDGNYVGSKGTLLGPNINAAFYPNGPIASVDIVSSSSGKPDFSFAPATCGATTSVQPGATAAGVTFTITPVNGFTGSVSLTATNDDGMVATPSFSVTPVSITTSAGVTTSFVVVASAKTTAAKSIRPGLRPSGRGPADRMPWYAAGSGATLAGLCLLMLPRRRRWGALLAAVITISALTAVGCGSNTSTTGGGGGTTPPAGTTNASKGTYTFTVTAISGTLVHSAQIAYVVP